LLATAALLAATSTSAARYSMGGESRVMDSVLDSFLQVSEQPIGDTSTGSFSDAIRSTTASTSVQVATGGIHVVADSFSRIVDGPTLVYSTATARGGFSDRFVLSAPGIAAGTQGTASFAFSISGGLDVTHLLNNYSGSLNAGGRAGWEAGLELLGPIDGVRWDGWQSITVDPWNTIADGNASFGIFSFSIPVVFGAPMDLSFNLRVEARSSAISSIAGGWQADARSLADLGHTAAWGGIQTVTDTNGAPILGFTALSEDSGFDYAQAYTAPVPEPSTTWMLMFGLAAMGARLLARRR
jgi:hypothetical protein